MLLQGTQLAPMDSMLPSVASTPRPDGTASAATGEGTVLEAHGTPYRGDFYSKYEEPAEPQSSQRPTERLEGWRAVERQRPGWLE